VLIRDERGYLWLVNKIMAQCLDGALIYQLFVGLQCSHHMLQVTGNTVMFTDIVTEKYFLMDAIHKM
jgi:hypothetical protein